MLIPACIQINFNLKKKVHQFFMNISETIVILQKIKKRVEFNNSARFWSPKLTWVHGSSVLKRKKAMYKEIIPSNCTYHEIINWSKPRSNYLNTLFLLGFKVGHPWFTHGQVHLFWPNLQYIMELRHYLNWQRTI